jgi:hypothetical protein
MRLAVLLVSVGAMAGCLAGSLPEIVEDRDVASALGAPRIRRVRDAGTGRLPGQGAWSGVTDEVAVPGELLLIEGDSFGRLPTVTVGGRAAQVLRRTDGGGIVVRVPHGVPSGEVEVAVAHPKGRSAGRILVKRLALVVLGERLHLLDVEREAVHVGRQSLAIPGARRVRLHADGGVAYVLASRPDGDVVVVVDLAARGGPAIVREVKLAHRATELVSAERQPGLAAIGDGQLTLFQVDEAHRPAPYPPQPIGVKTVEAAALSPDARTLAILVAAGNRLEVLDVERPREVKRLTGLELLPEARLPLVRDLAFAADGETLWVVSGANTQSLPAVEPTRLTAVRLVATLPAADPAGPAIPEAALATSAQPQPQPQPQAQAQPPARPGAPRLLSVWRTQVVLGASAPIRLAVAHGQPTASGTTIRMPPERAAIFVSAVGDALFKIDLTAADAAAQARRLFGSPAPGMIVRAALDGSGGPLFSTAELPSAIDLSPDSQLVVATAARPKLDAAGAVTAIEAGVIAATVFGRPTPRFFPLVELAPRELRPPFYIGDVRVQP